VAIKYQVFVSSTYEDLRKERDQVIKATLEMGHIPVGMEMFSAADEEQWKIITRTIDECDYYVVIVAHRCGSVVDGISYTEKEYDYAISNDIPVLGFVIEGDASWPGDQMETDADKKVSLGKFKEKVKTKPVGFWKEATDLKTSFSIALMKQINSTPRPGWTRADEVAGPKVVNELSRLSSENAGLRKQLETALHKAEDDADAERRRTMGTMRKNTYELSFFYEDGNEWEGRKEVSLMDLFALLAPEMMIEKNTNDIAHFIGVMRRPNTQRQIRDSFPIPSNTVTNLIADFVALGVFGPSQKRHTVRDTLDYWSLTEHGHAVQAQFRRWVLDEPEVDGDEDEPDSSISDGE
jgi:hypothetical protein